MMYESLKDIDLEECGYQQVTIEDLSFDDRSQYSFRYSKWFLVIPLLTICVIFLSQSYSPPILNQSELYFDYPIINKLNGDDLHMTAVNEYGLFKGDYPFLTEYSGSQLIEPYKNTTITLSGSLVNSKHQFEWRIEGVEGSLSGAQIALTLTKSDVIPVEIVVTQSDSGEYEGTYQTWLICKYVKREIRSLTTRDREAFLNAAITIWQYSTEEGRLLYGDKFTGIHTFVKEHATASEDIMCDQFHEGTGFLTHHLAITNSFEAALRSVDPSVTLPYWDFTIEGQTIDNDNINSLTSSSAESPPPSSLLDITPVFSDEWFGSVDYENHIVNSRWAHSKMPRLDHTDDDIDHIPHNSYGYFRSYWNNNDDPEVTRHMFDVCGVEDLQKLIPTCDSHFTILNTTTLGDFLMLSPVDGHGPMHVQIGGVFGGCVTAYKAFNDKWSSYLDSKMTNAEVLAAGYTVDQFESMWGSSGQRRKMFEKQIVGEYFHIYRGLWRSHMCAADGSSALLQCPESCDDSTPFEECRCSVPKLQTGDTNWQNIFPCIISNEEKRDYFIGSFSEEFLTDTVDLITSSTVKEGEMLHSGSPADILFWVIHPVIERLLVAKRLSTVTVMGSRKFLKWEESVESDSSNWLSYSYYNLEQGQNKFYPDKYTCVGHSAEDAVLPYRLPFTDAILQGGADANGDGVISNWEFFVSLDPNNVYANDYVFDHFVWNHCE